MWIDLLGSRARVANPTFLFRLTIGLLSGYFAAALGGAICLSYLSIEARDFSGSPLRVFLGVVVAPLAPAVFATQFLLVAMLPSALASLPFALAAALFARAPIVPTMLYGSLVGMGVGWPAGMRYFGTWEPSILPVAAVAGASFMGMLWHFTIGFDSLGRPPTTGR